MAGLGTHLANADYFYFIDGDVRFNENVLLSDVAGVRRAPASICFLFCFVLLYFEVRHFELTLFLWNVVRFDHEPRGASDGAPKERFCALVMVLVSCGHF